MIIITIGFIAGICTGLGLGGGSVLILLLDLVLNFNQHTAQATNLICFIPSSIIAICVNIKNKNIDFKIAFQIIILGIIGASIGALISSKLNVIYLKKLFGIFLICISIHEFYLITKSYIKRKTRHTKYKI